MDKKWITFYQHEHEWAGWVASRGGNQSETAKTSPQELSQEEAEQLLGNLSEDLKKFSQMQAGKIKPAQPYKNNLW